MNKYKIRVRNSCIIVENYVEGDNQDLESNFKVWNPLTHRYESLGMFCDAEKRRLYLPRGIDIWKIKKYLGEREHVVEKPNDYAPISGIGIKAGPRDEEQKEALRFMVGVDPYEENDSLPQLSINLSTGKGKTYCSIATISFLKIKTVVITHSVTLLNQWKDEIKHYTNLTDQDIFFISGSPMMNMIYNNKSLKAQNGKIFLITHGTIRSYADTYGWDKLNQVFQNLQVGIKIIDEAHTNFANMLMLDFFTNVAKTYYVTATPKRSDWREDRIYQLSIKNIPFIDLFDENNDPHTDYVALKFNSRPTATQISECRNMYGLDRNKYIDYITQNPIFYMMLHVVMDMVFSYGGRALFYIGTNEGILRVYDWLMQNYPEIYGDVGIYTSLLNKEQKLKEKQKKYILSTTKSAGLGEHIAGLKMTVVLAEPFKSEVLARQSLGRTRDPDTLYVELVDMGFRHIQKFYYSKLRIFNKYASSTSDTMIDQYELEKRVDRIIQRREEATRGTNPFQFSDHRFFGQEHGVDPFIHTNQNGGNE